MSAGSKNQNLIEEVMLRSAVIIFAAVLLTSCENDMTVVNQVTNKEAAAHEIGTTVDALYSDNGEVRAKLTAPVMNRVHDKEPYTEMPSGLMLNFFDDSLSVISRLTAGYGIAYDKTDEMIARNNVVVTNSANEKLNTEELIWNEKTQKISSTKFVQFTTKDEIIYGDGFESNQDLTNYTVKKIRGTIHLQESALP